MSPDDTASRGGAAAEGSEATDLVAPYLSGANARLVADAEPKGLTDSVTFHVEGR
ncbi:hypothetical protein [Haloferax sulfurifontis]|uniref:Uncharacterized protein n=1 Tax=Haloferax sulfurifontis TaxID=255616 RepID=A0A830DUD7_9EURY|nr:hypothetical protein [Haloferax sulfurifontis]GGC42483.1 hypothetical protein GCM10007209_00190 [Haloferax sulfurifontis]